MWHIIRLIVIILSILSMFLCQFVTKDIYAEVSSGIMAIFLLQIELKGSTE